MSIDINGESYVPKVRHYTANKNHSFPLSAAAVNLGGGLTYGYAIGIFTVISQWQADLTTCDRFLAKSACEGAEVIGDCVWVPMDSVPDDDDDNDDEADVPPVSNCDVNWTFEEPDTRPLMRLLRSQDNIDPQLPPAFDDADFVADGPDFILNPQVFSRSTHKHDFSSDGPFFNSDQGYSPSAADDAADNDYVADGVGFADGSGFDVDMRLMDRGDAELDPGFSRILRPPPIFDYPEASDDDKATVPTKEAADEPKQGECRYPGDAKRVCATLMTTDTCSAGQEDAKCAWNYDEKKCQPEIGWSPVLAGLYSSLFIVGCALGGPLASLVLSRGGRKNGLYVIISLGLISQVIVTLGWQFNVYTVQVVGRFIAGLSGGMACVVSPIYAEEMFGRHEWIGTLFQLGCTTGIVLPAFMGFIMDPYNADGVNSKFGHGAHTQAMLHVVFQLQTVLIVVFFGIVSIVPESLATKDESTASSPEPPSLAKQFADASIGSKLRQMCPFLLPIIGICGAQQLTGINAIINYAPSIMSSAGLRPLEGNFYVMLWNWVTTPMAIPLVRYFKPKAMFFSGMVLVTIVCFLGFITSYPGIIGNEKAMNWLTGVAIFLFVACFEIGVGPNFFILAQDMFPKHLQNFGTSLTITVVMTFSVIINFIFPVMRKELSGSENNLDKGQAYSFLIFGAAGALSSLCVFLTIPKLRSEREAEKATAMDHQEKEDTTHGESHIAGILNNFKPSVSI